MNSYFWATPSGPINLIKAEDMPMMNHWPEGTPMYSDYNAALQRAKESSVPIQDQDRAKKLIGEQIASLNPGSAGLTFIQPGTIYGPFTVWYKKQGVCCSPIPPNINHHGYCDECDRYAEVAILYDDTPEKTDYINKELKTVSEVDLKAALRKVNEKNKEIRESYKDHTRLDFRIKDSRGFPTGEVVEAAKVTPEAEVSPRVAKLILSIRDELLKLEHCPEEAYYLLYQIASPSFDKRDPWSEIEKIAADTPEKEPHEDQEALLDELAKIVEYVDGEKVAHRFRGMTIPVIEYNELIERFTITRKQ